MQLSGSHSALALRPCGYSPGSLAGPQLKVHLAGDPYRRDVEQFIHDIYARRFGADVESFAPSLVSLCDESGILAAAGYREATSGPLFLEHYLDQPIESLLTSMRGGLTTRHGIVEVGHLSARQAGEGRRLILRLGQHLAEQEFGWVVTTVTQELLHLFNRIGLTPLTLGTADPLKLGRLAGCWGTYYDHHPRVVCGQLEQAIQQMARRLPPAEVRT